MEYVLGIDVGTSGARVGIYDRVGHVIAFYDEAVELHIPHPGWAEQDPEEWWQAICRASRRALQWSHVNPRDIRGLSLDTTCCTMVFCDENMNSLCPSIMWMDMRASQEAKDITASGHDALKYNGYGPVSAECLPAKVLWVKRNRPELYNKAVHICECVDYLTWRLTGEYTASLNNASTRWYYNTREGGYPLDFYAMIGLEDMAPKLPRRVLPMGEKIGGLLAAAAEDMGLCEGIPVGEGGADAFVGVIGLNAIDEGKMALITGSSHLHVALLDNELHHKGMWGTYPDAIVPGKYMIEGGQTSTGSIISWVKNQLCGNERILADEKGCSIYDILNEEAEKRDPGAHGLLALDFFQGNRTPHVDSDVRGMIYGLSLIHTPADIYRALVESVCYGTKVITDTFASAGFKPSSIVVSGGIVKSRFWLQTHADVCGVSLIIPRDTEAPCLGSAILGAVAGGLYPDIATAAKAMTAIGFMVDPDFERHEEYMFYYEKYRQFYENNREWMHEITRHISQKR